MKACNWWVRDHHGGRLDSRQAGAALKWLRAHRAFPEVVGRGVVGETSPLQPQNAPWWQISSNKATPPNPAPNSPPALDQAFRCTSLWSHSHSNLHKPNVLGQAFPLGHASSCLEICPNKTHCAYLPASVSVSGCCAHLYTYFINVTPIFFNKHVTPTLHMRLLMLKGKSVQGHSARGQGLFWSVLAHKAWALKMKMTWKKRAMWTLLSFDWISVSSLCAPNILHLLICPQGSLPNLPDSDNLAPPTLYKPPPLPLDKPPLGPLSWLQFSTYFLNHVITPVTLH